MPLQAHAYAHTHTHVGSGKCYERRTLLVASGRMVLAATGVKDTHTRVQPVIDFIASRVCSSASAHHVMIA